MNFLFFFLNKVMLLNFIYISLSNSPVLLYPNSPFKWVIFVM